MRSRYTETIKQCLEHMSLTTEQYPTHQVEAYLRELYSTLDHLTLDRFFREIAEIVQQMDAAPAGESEQLAESYGLRPDTPVQS